MKVPSSKTLAKYGMTADDFTAMFQAQKGKCAVCYGDLAGKQMFIDHEHRAGFSTMTAEKKRMQVRGILDYSCNRFRVCRNNYLTAQAVLAYLEQHEDRKRRQSAA